MQSTNPNQRMLDKIRERQGPDPLAGVGDAIGGVLKRTPPVAAARALASGLSNMTKPKVYGDARDRYLDAARAPKATKPAAADVPRPAAIPISPVARSTGVARPAVDIGAPAAAAPAIARPVAPPAIQAGQAADDVPFSAGPAATVAAPAPTPAVASGAPQRGPFTAGPNSFMVEETLRRFDNANSKFGRSTASARQARGGLVRDLVQGQIAGANQQAGIGAQGANQLAEASQRGTAQVQAGRERNQAIVQAAQTQADASTRASAISRPQFQTGADGQLYTIGPEGAAPVTGPDGKPFRPQQPQQPKSDLTPALLREYGRERAAANQILDPTERMAALEAIDANPVYAALAGGGVAAQGAGSAPAEGQIFEDANGNRARLVNGQYVPVE